MPSLAQARSMGMVCVSREKHSIPGAMAKRFALSFIDSGGSAAIVSTPLLKAGNWCGRIPGFVNKAFSLICRVTKDKAGPQPGLPNNLFRYQFLLPADRFWGKLTCYTSFGLMPGITARSLSRVTVPILTAPRVMPRSK